MPVNMHGQLAIQATAPGEDPIKVGSLWVDTSGTATLKVCTSISPYTFTEISGTDTGITQLTGDVTAGPGNGSQAATIANDAVTYAKMQNTSAASRLLGRGSAAGAGNIEELTVGSGLSLSGTELSATGGAGFDILQIEALIG